jgi:hypothetical protein
MFSQAVIENLEFYVYLLQDPRSGRIFYIGKGIGNRLFHHLDCALSTEESNDKLDTIREINSSGHNVQHYIIRHGLDEKSAFEIEAALIDFAGMKNLSNLQGGHHSEDFGMKTADEISAMYEAEEFFADDPLILININHEFDRKKTPKELYDATRMSWVMGNRRLKAIYAISTYRGLTREVYKIENWFEVPTPKRIRWGFEGKPADEPIRIKYRYKSIKAHFKRGAANPIKYFNC